MHSNRRGLLPPTRAFSLSIVYLRLSTLESTMHIKRWVDMNLGHLSEKFINQRVDWLAKRSEYYEIVDSSSHHAMARVRHCCLLVCVVSSQLLSAVCTLVASWRRSSRSSPCHWKLSPHSLCSLSLHGKKAATSPRHCKYWNQLSLDIK